MAMKPIIQIEPWIDNSELEVLKEVINSTFVTESSLTKKFEAITSEYTKSKFSIAVCNGTCALFCALKAIGLNEDEEVIVPNLTFISTATSVLLAGGKVRLVDVDPRTCCIDQKSLLNAINKKTKAIIPVHLYGISCEMDEIMSISNKYKIDVIEDAAQGVGVKYKNKHVGTFGAFGVLSYYGNKTITTGEGGIVLTSKIKSAEKIYMLKNHGRQKKGTFIHETLGWNFSFTEMQAALGISQMQKLERIIKKKYYIYRSYVDGVNNPKLNITLVPDSTTHPVHWFTNIYCDSACKLESYLRKKNIPTRRLFYPLNKQPCLVSDERILNTENSFFGADTAYNKILSLPSSVLLDDEQIKYIIKAINSY